MHFSKNGECGRSMREHGREPAGRTYFADNLALLKFMGETFT